ncbi:NADH-quinone oxidoreductase subunit C [Danxiaibacter flavus]|uniref:NADH-quinone oxidoreductase n=1 Tax=Danxiaibacter flavus TaxID=3049108 RepID=A0ABV3ZEN8_9BACT|nr:NADH-quinone oxidoreductase subunit C [Chitinophagaceae bacterium DXS]
MTNEVIKELVSGPLPSATFDESGEWLTIQIDAAQWKQLATLLYNAPYHFDYLFCLTCVDWKTHFTTVYHLTSTCHRQAIVVKAKVDRNDPQIETVSDIWKTADFHEREVFDLFGVRFINHSDLRRLILTEDFEGYPLRKDFEDPVNMIKL